ncbi:uncharacterized protein Z520_07786 [Fonsecaea multimorphosa CBS 102226]|uniref:AAA+ ATPase domain-containing protein n=1 Tax=Fonsecaea multimorphosa CBS 102226 TaxID=1442371 RepID=A0A0D2H3V5_9EURO|nr:uncharacterized protein Z520_07786 [Fonsecaea multimorphosa CBS 102226]KIX96520.1 hypothetical protein Z520_07786 [Fonsecaea multimorphosa CBS 102226]OAL28038.1 hypothetical protein AYO22_03065 [Fonsecaea multimorphosa]
MARQTSPESSEPSNPSQNSNSDGPDEETVRHLALFASVHDTNNSGNGNGSGSGSGNRLSPALLRELEAAPLFSSKVKKCLNAWTQDDDQGPRLPAYGLLGLRTRAINGSDGATTMQQDLPGQDNLIYANMQHPWSTFICGQQGAGKSHTMSCLLENALISDGSMGPNPMPMSGLVFHYDKFTSPSATQVCEAAYLSSQGIKVQVLVSPSNLNAMKRLYRNLPNWPSGAPRPKVIPFLFSERQLNVANLKALMAVDSEDKNPPLYMAIVNKVLKQLSLKDTTTAGVKYQEMKWAVTKEGLTPSQMSFLEMRYSLIEWFLKETAAPAIRTRARTIDFSPQTISIVDLSCPFITETDACMLFSIFLQIFLGQRGKSPLIIALDEAHKFLTETPAAKAFSEDLVQIIRQQRHLATRVVIATQEPTISPKLLDLCNVAIVHQFQSPDWYKVLQRHVAALAGRRKGNAGGGDIDDNDNGDDVFKTIVRLGQGEALVFCTKAYFDVDESNENEPDLRPLQDGYATVKIRGRVTADGGRSILASDAVGEGEEEREESG